MYRFFCKFITILFFFITSTILVNAATYTVNIEDDNPDIDLEDDMCADINGNCTLRAAVMQSNQSPGLDIINIPTGIYTITAAGIDEDSSVTGDFDISAGNSLIINGTGETYLDVIIDFNNLDKGFETHGILGSNVYFELNNVAITQAITNTDGTGAAFDLSYTSFVGDKLKVYENITTGTGSATFGGEYSEIKVSNSVFENQEGGEGVIANITEGSMEIEHSTFLNNSNESEGSNTLIKITGCSDDDLGTPIILSCHVRLIRNTFMGNMSDTFFEGVSNMGDGFAGCGNIFTGNLADNSPVCTLNKDNSIFPDEQNYNVIIEPVLPQDSDYLCEEPGSSDVISSNIQIDTILSNSGYSYSTNNKEIQYLKLHGESEAMDLIPEGVCGCSNDEAVDGDGDMIDRCDAGAYEYVPLELVEGSITGYVWDDINKDGIQNETENRGYNELSVSLYEDVDDDGTAEPDAEDGVAVMTDSTTDLTENPGYFSFNSLEPGDYFIVVTIPNNYTATLLNAGEDDSLDSDINSEGISSVFELGVAETFVDFGAGIYTTSSSSGGGGGGGGGGGSATTTNEDCDKPFPDIECTDIFIEYITNLKDNQIVGGYTDGTYRPSNYVTRGEMATFVVKAFGLSTNGANVNYNDSIEGPHKTNIEILTQLEVVSGFSDGSYRKDEYVNREQISKFIFNGLKTKGVVVSEASPNFPDLNSTNSFFGYIGYIQSSGIVNGYSDGRYGPLDTLTRGQMAKIIDIARKK